MPAFLVLIYFEFLLCSQAVLKSETKKGKAVKVQNFKPIWEVGEVLVSFVLLFRYVVWVQFFLYQRKKGLFLEKDWKCA